MQRGLLLCWLVPRLCASQGLGCRTAHTNFADESACTTANNVQNSYNSQVIGGVENDVPLHVDIFCNWLISLKKHTYNNPSCTYRTPDSNFTGWSKTRGLDVDSVNSSSDYFAYLCISASETKFRQKRMSIVAQSHLQQQNVETTCKTEPY
jgi:hypothetical protein